MRLLEGLIDQMDEKEQNEFYEYLKSGGGQLKVSELFKQLSSSRNEVGMGAHSALYVEGNLNAYHSLRKRLMLKLSEFISGNQFKKQLSSDEGALGWLAIAKFFIEKDESDGAAPYLEKAEVLAEKNKMTKELDEIYSIQISHAAHWNVDVEETIRKWELNRERLQVEGRLKVAQGLLKHRVSMARKKGLTIDPDKTMIAVFSNFDISDDVSGNAEFMYEISRMMRSSVVSAKEYFLFEPFILGVYDRLIDEKAFSKRNEFFKVGFLYMIAHVKYRNRKFSEALKWLEEMRFLLDANKSLAVKSFLSRYALLLAAIKSYSGFNSEAAVLLNEELSVQGKRLKADDRLNMLLNLSVYYFQSEDYRTANQVLLSISHTDAWLEEKMGLEWRFKKNLIEILVYSEMGHKELSLSRIESLQKHFGAFFQHPSYARASVFLRFIRETIERPERITSRQFAKEVEEANLGLPGNKEDIQAISFFCWLKAKMIGLKYYEVLLDAMK